MVSEVEIIKSQSSILTAEKTVGIVCEYNPFHFGHKHHILESLKVGGFNNIVCVMSGNFVQRGEPAIVRKHIRAECAVRNGADLVFELPLPYSISSAEGFAAGAIGILSACGVVDAVSFGCEAENPDMLFQVAEILAAEPLWFKQQLKRNLKEGISFARARQIAVNHKHPELSDCLSHPNNILGIEYLKAILRAGSKLKHQTVKRIGSSYNEPKVKGRISSATAIRELIYQINSSNNTDYAILDNYMPYSCRQLLENEFKEGRGPVFIEHFEQIILGLLRLSEPEDLLQLPDMSEGLENRLIDAAMHATDLKSLIELAGSTRYPDARIRRILIALITKLKSSMPHAAIAAEPEYFRVLAFNDKGRKLIRKMKDMGKHVITGSIRSKIYELRGSKGAGLKNREELIEWLKLECRASDMYVTGYPDNKQRKAGMDQIPAIYINS